MHISTDKSDASLISSIKDKPIQPEPDPRSRTWKWLLLFLQILVKTSMITSESGLGSSVYLLIKKLLFQKFLQAV